MTNLELIYNRMEEKYPKLYKVFTKKVETKTDIKSSCQIHFGEVPIPNGSLISDTIGVVDNFLEKLNNAFLNGYKNTFYVFNDDGFGSRKLRCNWNNDHYQILADVGFG